MLEDLKKILSEGFDIDCGNITAESVLSEIGIDSLAKIELSLEVETEFGIIFEDEDMANLVTVQDVINLIERKRQDS